MTKFDWEKQNRKEMVSKSFDLPATEDNQWLKDAEKHSKKRASAKKYRNKRISLAIKRKKEAPAFNRGIESGKIQERQLVMKLLESLRDEYQEKLGIWIMSKDDNASYETTRFKFHIQAIDDIRDMMGEQK